MFDDIRNACAGSAARSADLGHIGIGIVAALRPHVTTSAPNARMRLLLVDDSDLILRAMGRMLGRTYTVTTAGDGEDALAILREGRIFDVIVCDIAMPRMNGVVFYTTLQREYPQYAARFMFATGGAATLRSMRFLVDAPVKVLLKPVRPEALREAIEGMSVAASSAVG